MLKTVLLSLFAIASATVTDCGAGKSLFTIQSQALNPDPPTPGQSYDYWFAYTVPDGVSIDAGSVSYKITLNGIPFSPTVNALCTQTACPKTAGFHNETSSDTWPTGVSGKIVTTLEWKDGTGTLLLCSQITERM
jgi:hypothetical protein